MVKKVNSDVMKITQAKDETSILQTGKLCYNVINTNVFVFEPLNLQNCKRAQSFVLSPHIN